MGTEGLFDHRVDAALEPGRGLGSSSDQIREELITVLQFCKEVVCLAEPVMGVPLFLAGG